MSEPLAGAIDLTKDGLPGGNVNVGPAWEEADRPHPDDAPGDNSGGWLKVGAQYLGGRQFEYENGYYGIDGPAPWKQT